MPHLTSLVRSYNALDESSVADSALPGQIAQGLVNKQWKLIDIVKELGEALVSEDDAVRSRGVGLLANVVKSMDRSTLDRQSTKTLVTFFTDKLGDKSSMVSCVSALAALTESPMFGSGEGIEVARGIFTSITLQGNPQAVRFTVYSLLDSLMARARPALKRMGKEFVKGYCTLAEGEKDPRNLMLSFGMVHVILIEFDITDCVEDLFDITFCYFPITFTPPPDDPYGISSDDLVVALRKCLCASASFGPLALPLFLDKMQAASEKAKRQTLQALADSFPVYGPVVCGEWAGRFSEALTIEIFHSNDDEMMELALTAFTSLFDTLYPDISPGVKDPVTEDATMGEIESGASADAIEGVAIKVVANALEELKEPDKSNAKPAVRILTALISSSNRIARYVLGLALPQLLAFYKDQDEVALRPAILTCLAGLLDPLTKHASSPSAIFLAHSDGNSPLEPVRDDLLAAFTSGSRSPTSRAPALEGLVNLVKIPGFLSGSELSYCLSAINDVLQSPSSEDEHDAALDGLVTIAELHPTAIEQSTLPLLFAMLPSEAPTPGSKESEAYRRALSSLSVLCTHPSLFEVLALRILSRLEPILSSPSSGDEFAALYAHHLLATLRAVMKSKVDKGHADIGHFSERFLPRLLGFFILPTMHSMDHGEVAKDPRLLLDAGKIVTLVTQRLDAERQTYLATALNAAFHLGDVKALIDQVTSEECELPFTPFAPGAGVAQEDTISLFSSAIIALRPVVTRPAAELVAFLQSSLVRAMDSTNETQLVSELHLIGSLINKRAQDVSDFLATDVAAFWAANVADTTSLPQKRRRGLRVYTWIAKGLIVRSDQRGYDAVDNILSLMNDPELGQDAAAALGVIAEESDRVLSKENFSVIRLLYKQRFFSSLLPKLVAAYKAASGADQAVYLTALSHLLHHIPRQLTLTELPKLLPLLVSSLDLPDLTLRANVIDTLSVLVKEVPMEMDASISSMALKVLRGVVGEAANSKSRGAVKLRIASLNFLAVLPAHIPYTTLHPQKATILKELGKAVDDPRRDVRRAAVDCRSKWFMYSG